MSHATGNSRVWVLHNSDWSGTAEPRWREDGEVKTATVPGWVVKEIATELFCGHCGGPARPYGEDRGLW